VPGPRRLLALVPVLCGLLLAGTLPPAQAAPAVARDGLPEKVTIHDSRTSDPLVDISVVRLQASWYWDSEQLVVVKVPHGFRAGHQLTVFFDLNGDSSPDGHFNLELKASKRPGGKTLRVVQGFRRGGGWDQDGGTKAGCSGSEGPPVEGGMRVGDKDVYIGLDLWSCAGVAHPPASDPGSWRAAVRLGKGGLADMAPNGRRWSEPLRGWGPCDPSGGSCG
jgi:hypothetical protein